jgi:hypothetical protein
LLTPAELEQLGTLLGCSLRQELHPY